MKKLIAILLTTGGIVAIFLPSPVNAEVFNWFSFKKVVYQPPLTAFVSQNFGVGSWEDISEADKTNLQLIKNTALVAIDTPAPVTPPQKSPVRIVIKSTYILATAYSSTVDQTDDSPFITAWGTRVRDGIIAANFLPFGTIIRIPDIFGEKTFIVEDRMHSRFSDRVDVWFPTRQEALNFGAQRVKIEVVS